MTTTFYTDFLSIITSLFLLENVKIERPILKEVFLKIGTEVWLALF
jgi:hypothetical protein